MDFVHVMGLWHCKTDPILLEAAILNLVVNARDAMLDQGSLLIEAANVSVDPASSEAGRGVLAGEYVRIVVSDTGHGMPPEVAERAFEPFFTTKEAGKGSGLGLSQVYGFIQQSKGHVLIDSSPSKGTAISLYLPRIVVGAEPLLGPKVTTADVAGGSETVLIVEDNELVRDTMEMMTESLGYRVLSAGGAGEALHVIDGNSPIDIVVSDIVMAGGINGSELANRIRARRPNMPILLVSGYPTAEVEETAKYPILRKPYRRGELAHQIRVALDNRITVGRRRS